MLVPMMCVGEVGMCVLHFFMLVPMTVFCICVYTIRMRVLVVLIVSMFMLMRQCCVLVWVFMLLGKVQPDTYCH